MELVRTIQAKKIVGLLALFFTFQYAEADWSAESTLLIGEWGNEETQFGIQLGDVPAYDIEPGGFSISDSGIVVMNDQVNKRLVIVNQDEGITGSIPAPAEATHGWGLDPVFSGDNVFSLALGKFYFISLDGDIVNVVVPSIKRLIEGGILQRNRSLYVEDASDNGSWYKYSSNGEIERTYSQRPLEIGRISEDVFLYDREKRYRTTVEFNDEIWTIAERFSDCDFQRDESGNLYCVSEKKVVRYNDCGKPVAEIALPEDDITIIPRDVSGVEDEWVVNSRYMDPKIDIHGNVYATRRTQENYSLVRWTWEDSESNKNEGPDAPINLTTNAEHETVVQLNWERSLQDPGCVTGYRVLRSETLNEVGEEILTFDKGTDSAFDNTVEEGKTYYYRIQALSEVSDSEPSAVSSVEIQVQ